MEIVDTLDIDGTQWKVQDTEARNKIAVIEDFLTAKKMPDINIKLNNGYNAREKFIGYVQKYGKLYMGLLYINNLSGNGIGTNTETYIGNVDISLNNRADAVGIEYISSKPVHVSISKTGNVHMQESAGITNGNNCIRIPITWIEA